MVTHHDSRVATVGIDGCRGGWVIASRDGAIVAASLDLDARSVVGIDMPIGLPCDAPRPCDALARRFLGKRASTIFDTPARSCLGSPDHATASARHRDATGRGLSIQAFHLLPKIAALDAIVTPALEDRVVEVHPECSFAFMNDGQPLAPKRTAEGLEQRRSLLETHGATIGAVPRGARLDDLLDAMAVRWSTERFVRGEHHTFTDGSRDERGLLMRIVS